MASNSTGMQPPRPPPPSARDTPKESAGRPARRASNRPPGKSAFRSAQSSDRHVVDASLWESAPSRAPTPAQSAPVNTRELRDELVRALMPELRTLVEHLVAVATDRSVAPAPSRDVDAAIARAIAPLLERQRTLEATIVELQRNALATKTSAGVAQRSPERLVSPGGVQVETQAWVSSPANGSPVDIAIPRALPPPRVAATLGTKAFDTTPWADIPAELNGSRRKRIVLWLLALGLIALLGTAVALSVMSNAGAHVG